MSSLLLLLFCIAIPLCFAQEDNTNQKRKKPKDKYEVLKEEWCGDSNCYDILQVTADVDFRQIKDKYNNLSFALHPDKNPNQSIADKERYVRVNKAYEILSSKRRDYDEYLRIKVSFDSPVESPIIVLVLLYLGIAYVVLYYQRQQQQTCKEAILKNASVIRYFWEEKKIDLTGKKKASKGPRGKKGRKNKKNGPQNLSEIMEGMDKRQLNEIIARLNLSVAGWKESEPTYRQAMFDVLFSVVWALQSVWFQIRWILRYKLCKCAYTDEDRVYLCRKSHNKSESEWNAIPEQDRQKLLNKPGKWRKKSKNGGGANNNDRRKKKRN